MKKMLTVMVVAVMLVGYSAVVRAESKSATVPVSFEVAAEYGFTVDPTLLDLGSIKPGWGKEPKLHPTITCSSNHATVWKLALNANPFSNGAVEMPSNPGFKCSAWSNDGSDKAQGVFAPGMVVPAIQTDFYTSTLAEGSDQKVPITLGLYVNVPATQASGSYTTNLIITMYE